MKLSDKIKTAISSDAGFESIGRYICAYVDEILAAVEAAEEGRVLPRLPDGWFYYEISQYENPYTHELSGKWMTNTHRWNAETLGYDASISTGPTPEAAAQAAIENIGK